MARPGHPLGVRQRSDAERMNGWGERARRAGRVAKLEGRATLDVATPGARRAGRRPALGKPGARSAEREDARRVVPSARGAALARVYG